MPQRLHLRLLWSLKHEWYPQQQQPGRLSKLALRRSRLQRELRHSVLELGAKRRGLRLLIPCVPKRLQPEPRSVRTGVYPLRAMGEMSS